MNNKQIIDYLKELVDRRNIEQVQNQELNNWTKDQECCWQDRTDEILQTVHQLENSSAVECECKLLTLDEAIQHANEVAERDDSSCSKQHKQLANWLIELKNIKNSYQNC